VLSPTLGKPKPHPAPLVLVRNPSTSPALTGMLVAKVLISAGRKALTTLLPTRV
jgi:hypothetical protein